MNYRENGRAIQVFGYTEWTPDKVYNSAGKTNVGLTHCLGHHDIHLAVGIINLSLSAIFCCVA